VGGAERAEGRRSASCPADSPRSSPQWAMGTPDGVEQVGEGGRGWCCAPVTRGTGCAFGRVCLCQCVGELSLGKALGTWTRQQGSRAAGRRGQRQGGREGWDVPGAAG
jgi:hypothetical protein